MLISGVKSLEGKQKKLDLISIGIFFRCVPLIDVTAEGNSAVGTNAVMNSCDGVRFKVWRGWISGLRHRDLSRL